MRRAFTLIEIFIVLTVIAILATAIVAYINPGARFAQMRDLKRRENLERIYSAVQNKLLSEEGVWQDCPEIPFEPTIIGKGEGKYDLYSCLIPKYLSQELYDPKDGDSTNTQYEIWRTGLGEIGLRAKSENPPGYIIVGALPNLAIVTTLEPKNITDVSADTGGKVHYQGDSEVTERGIVFSTQARSTVQDNKISAGSGLGEFEVILSNLEPETTYYVRAYAINQSGVSYGPEYSFKTQTPTIPRIRTLDPTDIKVHSATLNGKILSLGQYPVVKVYFQYRKEGESGWPGQTSKISFGQTGNFSQTVSGLDAETNYEFRAMGDYADGTAEGEIKKFTTLSSNPVVKTEKVANITYNSAILYGNLVSLGIYSQVNVFFLYKKASETSWIQTNVITKNSPGEFSIQVSLDPLTDYQFKAVASYDGKTVEGDVLSFSTPEIPPPSVETSDATSQVQPGLLKVTLKGNLISLGGYNSIQGYFRYRKKGETNWLETSKQTLTKTGYFTQDLTNLQLNTEYEFEALAGYDGKVASGGVSSFVTPTGDVQVESREAEIISPTSAKIKGELVSLGVYTEAWVYFRYQKLGEANWYQTQKLKMTSPGTFSATLTNLESNTSYRFYALADYDDGKTAQGYVLQFTTPKRTVTVLTLDASNITIESATLNGKLTDLGDYSKVNVYFKWRKSGTTNWQETSKKEMTNIGEFSANISGLEINTSYEFKALADYDGKTAEGDVKTFTTPKEGVKVQTNQATKIESDSAVLNGKVTYIYGYSSCDVYFRYRKTGSENWFQTPSQTLYGTEAFSYTISNLTENTQYEFEAVASYAGGTKFAYGGILNFTTLALVKIETSPATEISHFEATLNGNLTSLGSFSQAQVYFEYRKQGETTWNSTSKTTKTTTGTFSSHLTSLSSNTTYEFRARADYQNPNTGRNYSSFGTILTFTTPKVPVSVETLTLDKNDYTGDTATLRGRVSSLGDYPSAQVFFRYRQPGTPWYQTQKATLTSPANFSAQISGLSPNTQTEYQALAQYDSNIASGNILTFTTDPPEFRVETRAATNIACGSATLNGEVTSLGTAHSAQVYFRYKRDIDANWSETPKITLSTKTAFSQNISTLGGNTYQFKARADYTGGSWEGSTLSFTSSGYNLGGACYPYRRPVTINNTQNSNNLTNYQVLVTLDTASLISAGKMRSDCGDIRFTDSDGSTLLNYWIESGCNSGSTRIWVKVPSIPANSSKTIYVYYGNSSATSQSNPTATFIFFDDAEQNYGNWESIQGRWHRESGSNCRYQGSYGWAYSSGCLGGYSDYENASLQSKAFNLPSNTRIEFYSRGYTESCCDYLYFEISYNGGSSWSNLWSNRGSWSWSLTALTPSSSSNTKIRFRFYSDHSVTYSGVAFDYLKIRAYTSPEPTTSVGAEQ